MLCVFFFPRSQGGEQGAAQLCCSTWPFKGHVIAPRSPFAWQQPGPGQGERSGAQWRAGRL